MKVSFTGKVAPFETHGVNFQAEVDGSIVNCYISDEALQNIDSSPQGVSAVDLFQRNRSAVEAIAERKIRAALPIKIYKSDIPPST